MTANSQWPPWRVLGFGSEYRGKSARPSARDVGGNLLLFGALAAAVALSGCTYHPPVISVSPSLPEEIYVKTDANVCRPYKVGIFRFSEPHYAPKTGKIAAEVLCEEILQRAIFPRVISEIEQDDMDQTRLIDFAQSHSYDLIVTGDLLYYFDGSDLASSRVEECIKVTHVPTHTLLWRAATSEAKFPVFPTDYVLGSENGLPAPAATGLLRRNAKKFCNMLQAQISDVFLPCMDHDGDCVPDENDQCPATPRGIAVDVNGCPLDSDGDSVPDYLDKCLMTPQDVRVDENGCPLDSDGDSVPDYLDKCPMTPRGVAVDENGCPKDKDGDGVPDYLDQCPRTPMGVNINEVGCWVCEGVLFDFGRWYIKPEFYAGLNKVVEILKNASFQLEVQGHTDSIGPKEYNQRLSEKRAWAVIEYLVRKGIARKRLRAKGFGFTRPVAPNETEEGRRKNRRVQLNPIY